MAHTPEPWVIGEDSGLEVGDWQIEPKDARGLVVICARSPWQHRAAESAANGQRIVACVNALAGRDPAKLAELEAVAERVAGWLCECHKLKLAAAMFGQPEPAPCASCQARAALKAFRGED